MSASSPGNVPAVIMAAGDDSAEFAAAGEDPQRPLATIHGRPMVAYVVDALRAAGVREVVLVCRPGYPRIPGVDRSVEASGGMVENLGTGLFACEGSDLVLFATADIPFLTAAGVDDYVLRGAASGASLCWAAIPRSANEARFPGMTRTYVRLADGEFTGGNLSLVRPEIWPGIQRVLGLAYQARKKPWLIAQALGPRVLWRLLRHTLTIAEAEARIGEQLGGPVRAIITHHAELGADVDRPEDLRRARELLAPAGHRAS